MASLTDFDKPLFKKLAHNDTGQAVGHQAGFLVPKDLEDYFPTLSALATPQQPTVSENVTAFLFHINRFITEVQTRYQYQTWGGTRTPERRMTGNLTPLLGLAAQDDLLLIERGISDPAVYRFTLIRQADSEYQTYAPQVGTRRWGTLIRNDPPALEPETAAAVIDQVAHEAAPFELFDEQAEVVETHSRKVSRSRAFQLRLVEIYGGTCSLCGNALTRPDGKSEAEAAHIVSRSLKGSDDSRNGLLLCRAHHWAFDQGLIAIDDQYQVLLSPQAESIAANQTLLGLVGQKVTLPQDAHLAPDLSALEWHRKNIFRS